MFRNVYHNEQVKRAEDVSKVRVIITSLYEYYLDHPESLSEELLSMVDEFPMEDLVKDHIAGMTDRYAVNTYNELFVAKGWR